MLRIIIILLQSVTESDSESDRYSGSIQDTDTSSSGPTDITTAVTKLPSGGQLKKKGIQVSLWFCQHL